MSDDLIDILGKSRMFSGFSSKQLKEVVSHLKPRALTFKKGEMIYKKGEPAECCWLIQSGNLAVKRASFRTSLRKMIYYKGSVTGIQGLAHPGSKRAVSMIALDKVKLIEITYEGVSDLDQATQIQLWKNISKLLLRKLAVCLERDHH